MAGWIVSLTTTAGRLTCRSYQQALGRLERELGIDRPLVTLTIDR